MEALATVDWLLTREHIEPALASVRAALNHWPGGESAGHRKQRLFSDKLLLATLDRRCHPDSRTLRILPATSIFHWQSSFTTCWSCAVEWINQIRWHDIRAKIFIESCLDCGDSMKQATLKGTRSNPHSVTLGPAHQLLSYGKASLVKTTSAACGFAMRRH
jgi:hypothetical protein